MFSPNLKSAHYNSIYNKQTVFRILESVFYTLVKLGFTGVFIFALISALLWVLVRKGLNEYPQSLNKKKILLYLLK